MFSAFNVGIFIVSAKRTPFGTYGGKLKNFTANDLQEVANKAALEAGKVAPELIDSVFVGNVMQVSQFRDLSTGWNHKKTISTASP